jgi:hypothetical protein
MSMMPVVTFRHDQPVGTLALNAVLSIALPEQVTVSAAVLVDVALGFDAVAVGALLTLEAVAVGTAPLDVLRYHATPPATTSTRTIAITPTTRPALDFFFGS